MSAGIQKNRVLERMSSSLIFFIDTGTSNRRRARANGQKQ